MKFMAILCLGLLTLPAMADFTTGTPIPRPHPPSKPQVEKPAVPTAPQKPGKTKSHSVYDGEAATSFTAKVKALRDLRGETEVFFEHPRYKSPYSLPAGARQGEFMKWLERSAKPGGPQVKIQVDDQDRITSVEMADGDAKSSSVQAPSDE